MRSRTMRVTSPASARPRVSRMTWPTMTPIGLHDRLGVAAVADQAVEHRPRGVPRQLLAGDEGGDPEAIVDAEGLRAIGGGDELEPLVAAALDAHPDVVAKLREGNFKPIGVIVGHVMRETRGRADAGEVTRIVRERIGA